MKKVDGGRRRVLTALPALAGAPWVRGVAFEAVGRPSFYGTWLAPH